MPFPRNRSERYQRLEIGFLNFLGKQKSEEKGGKKKQQRKFEIIKKVLF